MRHWVAVVCGLAMAVGCGAELAVDSDDDGGDTGDDDAVVDDEWAVGQPGLAPVGPSGYGNGGSEDGGTGIDAGSGTGGEPDATVTDAGTGSDCAVDADSGEDIDGHTDEHGNDRD